MATNANEILDRLAALLSNSTSEPWSVQVADYSRDFWRVVHGHAEVFDDGSACGEYSPACDEGDRDAIIALRNAAPALIRLARASIATTKGEPISMPEWAAVCHEHSEAIKALGEVRL